jgi:hypothetical protein
MTFVLTNVETQAGFEPALGGFADRRVTTSPLRHNSFSLMSAGSSAPAAARPRSTLHDRKRCLCALAGRGPRIPIPRLLRVELRVRWEDKGRLHWRLESMGTAASWSASVETLPVPPGSYPRPSTMEALPEELLQSGWHRHAQPSVPPRDNLDCGQPGTPVHEFLERLSGSLPPMASAKADANCLVRSA